ncbi:MAG: hypothetical protein K6A34_06150 [Methanobrevibacter sp.]|nr:hypothetical protein [Methanobrevibacter sp.]
MMFPFFENARIELYSYNEQEEDFFGEKHEYQSKGEYPADVQPLSPASSQRVFGKILQDTYKVLLNIDVPIEDTDLIKIPNLGTFEIVGSVETWNHGLIDHKEITIKKHRKEVINYEHDNQD